MITEIRKLLKEKKLVMGSDRVMKMLKNGELEKVFIAKNAPKKVEDEVKYYSNLNSIELMKLDVPNEELGMICRKPFSILLLGVIK